MKRTMHGWIGAGGLAATGPAAAGLAAACVVGILMAAPALGLGPVRAQTAPATRRAANATFSPLESWKAAVVAGDENALAGFYVPSALGQKTPSQGNIRDASGEPAFWASLKPAGLTQFNFKVLEIDQPRPDLMAFVFRCDVKLRNSAGDFEDVVGGVLVWMKGPSGWKIVETQRSDPAAYVPRRLPEPAKPNTQLYPAPALAAREIVSALAEARADHKRVILVFGGNWCYDCHVLDATFHSKDIAPLVQQNYHVVHVNIGNYDQNLDLAMKYQIPLEKGVPSLAVLDPDGKLLYSQKQGDFENTVRIGPEDVTEFLQKWKP